jgi:hypothetical protein
MHCLQVGTDAMHYENLYCRLDLPLSLVFQHKRDFLNTIGGLSGFSGFSASVSSWSLLSAYSIVDTAQWAQDKGAQLNNDSIVTSRCYFAVSARSGSNRPFGVVFVMDTVIYCIILTGSLGGVTRYGLFFSSPAQNLVLYVMLHSVQFSQVTELLPRGISEFISAQPSH